MHKRRLIMKKRKANYNSVQLYKKLEENAQCEDTRYYGVFLYGNKKQRRVKIDPIRYQKKVGKFNPAQLSIINSRHSHYFYPAKVEYLDYNINIFLVIINSYLF